MTSLSMKWVTNITLMILAVFTPIKAALVSALVLIMFDLLTGVWAALKRHEHISSAGLGRTVVKFCVYECAVVMGFITETYLTGDILPICKMITALIGITELKSILENLDTISGGKFFTKLIKKLGSKNDEIQ